MDFQNDYFCLPFHSPDVDFFQDTSELRDLIYSGPEVEFRDWTAYPLLAPDQQAIDPPSHEMVDVGHTVIPDVGAEPIAVEGNKTPAVSTRKRSDTPEKRRARLLHKSDLIREIRTTVGLESGASRLEVLNAAIQRLSTVTQPGYHCENERTAYEWLHHRTGDQGRLIHARCLKSVIHLLNGLPALDPILVGQPSGSI